MSAPKLRATLALSLATAACAPWSCQDLHELGDPIEFRRVAAASGRACGISTGGEAWCWGSGAGGVLGTEQVIDSCLETNSWGNGTPYPCSTRPVLVSGGIGWSAISPGGCTCGLDERGRLWCWGANSLGACGWPVVADAPVQRYPRRVETVQDERFQALSGKGGATTCAVTEAGDLRCWGPFNHVTGAPAASAGKAPAECRGGNSCQALASNPVPGPSRYVDVAVGQDHACALTTAGAVECWGTRMAANPTGAPWESCASAGLAPECLGTPRPVTLPGRAAAIASGPDHVCALLEDGSLVCWGNTGGFRAGWGQSGTQGISSPVAFSAVDAAQDITCAIARDDGGVWCWGAQAGRTLGIGGEISPGLDAPTKVEGLPAAASLGVGGKYGLAVARSGEGWAWGWGDARGAGNPQDGIDGGPNLGNYGPAPTRLSPPWAY